MIFRFLSLLTLLFIFLPNWAFAQKENNNWYFGKNAGITFNSGSPVVLASSAMNTNEGTISVSDSAGNLLFYSDGITIWNRKHLKMQNGIGLMGGFSSTQSVLAVPKPGERAIYYIFTVNQFNDSINPSGLRYSILDMNLDGGFGAITNTKNVLLEVPVTEKLIAVRHGNNKGYWVLAHKWKSDEFIAYELTNAGVSTTPIISKIGSVHRGGTYNESAAGQMKANRDGSKLALAIPGVNKLELFDFNAFTGKISNFLGASLALEPYGVEFSCEGTKLYVTVGKYNPDLNFILQYNLADSTGLNAVFPIPLGSVPTRALQIGPDNKIYCNLANNYLGVINEPDSLGLACNFNSNGVSLNKNNSNLGLPNLIVPFRKKASESSENATLCIGEIITIGPEAVSCTSYLWQDGSTKSTYLVTEPGKYKLKVRNWYLDGDYEFDVQFKDCPVNISYPIFIPNIISPNQDNLNDAFVLKNVDPADFELQIFNRWGTLIYETKSYKNAWDAKESSAGIYYYLLRNSETGKTYKGWVEVVK